MSAGEDRAEDHGETTCCPNCGSTDIARRTLGKPSMSALGGTKWMCWDCRVPFEEPARRDRESGDSLYGTAKALDEMDPGSWP